MQTDPRFLERLRTAILSDDEDLQARARLIPRLGNGTLARSHEPAAGVVPRPGAVLIILYPHQERLFIPLTVRSSALRTHRGEISLPGGAIDPSDESPVAAALREAHEEIALVPDSVDVWGSLTPVYIQPSNFLITPVVAWANDVPVLHPSQHEVAEIIHVPALQLLEPHAVEIEHRQVRGESLMIPFYRWQQHKIWGATSIVLSQLAARIARALHEENV